MKIHGGKWLGREGACSHNRGVKRANSDVELDFTVATTKWASVADGRYLSMTRWSYGSIAKQHSKFTIINLVEGVLRIKCNQSRSWNLINPQWLKKCWSPLGLQNRKVGVKVWEIGGKVTTCQAASWFPYGNHSELGKCAQSLLSLSLLQEELLVHYCRPSILSS